MPTLMQRGLSFLSRSLTAAAGVAVTYTRGGTELSLTAWVGKLVIDQQALGASDIGRVQRHDRDYLIAAADLTLGPPEPGDYIAETVNGVAEVYEVIARGGPLPPWDWSDSGHTVYRVRTARTATDLEAEPPGVRWGGLYWDEGSALRWG